MPDPKNIRIFSSTADTDQSTSTSVDSPDQPKTRIPSTRSCTDSNTFADAASHWFQFGLHVIPILPGTKRPALPWDPWLYDLSDDKIRRDWTKHPNHELGFIVEVIQAMKASGTHRVVLFNSVYMGDAATRDEPAVFKVKATDSISIKVNGWYVRVLRRQVLS